MDEQRQAVRSLLARGLITLAEARGLVGISHQLMAYWARDLRYREIRKAHIATLWRTTLNRGKIGRIDKNGKS
jgi:hypothetical protein